MMYAVVTCGTVKRLFAWTMVCMVCNSLPIEGQYYDVVQNSEVIEQMMRVK